MNDEYIIDAKHVADFTGGAFMWTPQSLDPVSLVIRASDGQVYSPIQPVVKVCDCQNNGTCNYDQYTQESNIVNDKFAVSENSGSMTFAPGDNCSCEIFAS